MFNRLKLLRDKFNFNPKIIYDVGAYEGTWTSEAKSIFGSSVIYQFEANTDKKNYLIDSKSYLEVLSDSDDEKIIYNKTHVDCSTGNSIFKENTVYFSNGLFSQEERKTIRLDTLVDKNNLPKPDLLKIDTQGSELKILKGFSKYIDKVEIILLEISLHKYNKDAPLLSNVVGYMAGIDFIMIDIVDLHYNDGILIQIDALFAKKDSKFILDKF